VFPQWQDRPHRRVALHRLSVFLVVWLLEPSAPAVAQPTVAPAAFREQRDPTWTTASGTVFTLFPAGDIFPVYAADPHRPSNAIVSRFSIREGIPDARSPRWWLSAGGRFGMLRIETAGISGRSWQVGVEAGVDALFDTQRGNDGIGWDGNYGVTVTTASRSAWAFKAAVLHTSAHLADEHADRTGRTRLDYTREELAFGAARRIGPRGRLYGEVGRAHTLRNDGQRPWRLQSGIEYESAARLNGGRFGWYSAADLASWQERDWRVDRTVQGGIVTRVGSRTYRLFLELLDGRPQLGEFFETTELSLALGFRIDP
jgi:Protein of unknown function (DUF1207)